MNSCSVFVKKKKANEVSSVSCCSLPPPCLGRPLYDFAVAPRSSPRIIPFYFFNIQTPPPKHTDSDVFRPSWWRKVTALCMCVVLCVFVREEKKKMKLAPCLAVGCRCLVSDDRSMILLSLLTRLVALCHFTFEINRYTHTPQTHKQWRVWVVMVTQCDGTVRVRDCACVCVCVCVCV